MKIIKNRWKLQELAQTVVSLGKSLKFATNLTIFHLWRPKSHLVHEETMSGLGWIRLDPGLKRLRIRIQAGLLD